jgi:hypothetical protein
MGLKDFFSTWPGGRPGELESALLKMGNFRVEGVAKGQVCQEGVVRLYLDHLEEALIPGCGRKAALVAAGFGRRGPGETPVPPGKVSQG